MKALREIEVADVCYLSEAILWIALGRVPEKILWKGLWEARDDLKAVENFDLPLSFGPFLEGEIKQFLPDVDYESYLIGLSEVSEEGILSTTAECVRYAEKIYDLMEPCIDNARQRLALSLSAGEIDSACGFFMTPDEDLWDLDRDTSRSHIPKEAWILERIGWENSSLKTREGRFKLVTLETDELFTRFKDPRTLSDVVAGSLTGEYLVVNPRLEKGSRRGPDPKITEPIGRAIREILSLRHARDGIETRAMKIFALEEEVIEVAGILGQSIKRSTARRVIDRFFK